MSSLDLITAFKYLAYVFNVCHLTLPLNPPPVLQSMLPKGRAVSYPLLSQNLGPLQHSIDYWLHKINWDFIGHETLDLVFLPQHYSSITSSVSPHSPFRLFTTLSALRALVPCSLDELPVRAAGECLSWNLLPARKLPSFHKQGHSQPGVVSMRTPWPTTDRRQRINASSFHSWGKMVLSCTSEDPSENPDGVDFVSHEQHKNMSLFGFSLFHSVFCKLATWNPILKMLPMHKLSSQILLHGKSA